MFIFAQMLEIVALNDLASVLCARKFLFIGLSASAERPMDSRLSFRACVTAYLENRASDFDVFSQMLDIIVLNDLASVLCARKFSFAP